MLMIPDTFPSVFFFFFFNTDAKLFFLQSIQVSNEKKEMPLKENILPANADVSVVPAAVDPHY